MDFGSASYGVNKIGVENYVTELNDVILTQVTPTITNISAIDKAVHEGWSGKSAEDFITSLEKGAGELSQTLGELQKVFENQMNNIMESLADFDNSLFN